MTIDEKSVFVGVDLGTETATTVLARHGADGTVHIMEIAQTAEERARLERRLNWLRMKERVRRGYAPPSALLSAGGEG